MNSQRFAEIYEGLTSKEAALLKLKGSEYASNDEKLENFIKAASMEGKRPSEIAFTYFMKHVLSIQKTVSSGTCDLCWEKTAPNGDRQECIIQRISDCRNYALFILCCLEHESGQRTNFNTQGSHYSPVPEEAN